PVGPWIQSAVFGGSTAYGAVTLIQSNLGPGSNNLEVIAHARVGGTGQLVSFYREDGVFLWNGPFPVASGVTGNPVLIQGTYGPPPGNFELVVPLDFFRGSARCCRHIGPVVGPWIQSAVFGGDHDGVTLIQSNLGPGSNNLEVIARVIRTGDLVS